MFSSTQLSTNHEFRSHSAIAWSTALMLAWREIIRFFRQRNRVIGAVGQPILFWLLFGAGLSQSFRLSAAGEATNQDFLEYYFPGTLALIVLFTAIFATISIIEDRREGFLQAVMVSSAPRWSIVLGKVLGGATIAVAQGLLFVLLALVWKISLGPLAFLGVACLLTILAISLTALGFSIAWRMESTQGFHAIMNLFLMPLWLLSGAFFPPPAWSASEGGSQGMLHVVMRCNPVTYGVAGLRRLVAPLGPWDEASSRFWLPDLASCWIVSLAFAGAMLTLAWVVARQTPRGDLS